MKMHAKAIILGLVLTVAGFTAAHAHTGVGAAAGFGSGLVHPLTGVDHLLVMLALGLWAGQRGGRSVWAVPSAFAVTIAIAAAFGMGGAGLLGIDMVVGLSVVVLGVAAAVGLRPPVAIGIAAAALFGLAHGYVHGVEAAFGSGTFYLAGLVATTTLLLSTGVAVGLAVRLQPTIRLIGSGIALAGLFGIA